MRTLNKITDEDLQIIFNSSYRKGEKVTQFGQTIDKPNKRKRPNIDKYIGCIKGFI